MTFNAEVEAFCCDQLLVRFAIFTETTHQFASGRIKSLPLKLCVLFLCVTGSSSSAALVRKNLNQPLEISIAASLNIYPI